ncbi:MAG: replication-associated recombination protein A [Candidatus Falkowbacteria bacterium]
MEKVTNLPLATYFRPQKLADFVGHDKILNEQGFLYSAIKNDRVPSLIFWGPPGTGKTTLALIIAKETQADFLQLSAVNSGVKDLRQVVERAESNFRMKIKTILFVDEIHRWNKAQQDALLPEVENGRLILIGATTENPSFALNSALLSRAKVVVLDSLLPENLAVIIKSAAKKLKAKLSASIVSVIARYADGDARAALNILEAALSQSSNPDLKIIKEIIDKPNLLYDKTGEQHYNLISALHKSMRGGDANASMYWLARMMEGGEDPLYVARRLLRFASEDVGLANNSALMLANSVFDACHKLGLPECKVHLAQLVVYLAKSPKSVASYNAYDVAKREVETSGSLPVPIHLRNAPTGLMKDLGYGKDYKYTPMEDSSKQEYLPKELKDSALAKLKWK